MTRADLSSDEGATPGRPRIAAWIFRLVSIGAFVALTNAGFTQRVTLLADQHRWITLGGFVGVWALSLVAILVAALQPSRVLRVAWAAVIVLSTVAGFAYYQLTGAELGPLDLVSLWTARHEASRALDFYSGEIKWGLLVLAAGLLIMTMPPVLRAPKLRRWARRLAFAPAVPVAVIAAIVVVKEGGGAEVLPSQFAPLSVALVSGVKLAALPVAHRQELAWTWRGPFAAAAPRGQSRAPAATPQPAAIRRIVMLIDESIRADYIDWTPGNPFTPNLARLKANVVDFGPAASAGNCSHYSNALLRFAAARRGVGPALLTNPTLWQYAKKAGFRTAYIDAQAAFNRNPGKLQNFMTAEETRAIDAFYPIDGVPPPALDNKLLELTLAELRSEQPVFVYANKNGAHFPYDRSYPETEKLFQPTMTQAASDSTETRVNSYRNAVAWSVDRFFARLFAEADLRDTVIIYTSDHGQNFDPKRLSHCTVEDPDPREGYVPLFVITGSPELRARFAAAAQASRYHGSHFAIVPTVLQLLGYAPADIAGSYGASLLESNSAPPAFTTGDIFGLFSSKTRWHPIDLTADYLEPAAKTAARPRVTAGTAPAPVR